MLKCPNCEAILKQDFGMVTCSECQSVLMIDISGQVQMAGDQVDYSEASGEDDSTNGDWADDSTDSPEESYTAPDDFESIQTLDSDVAEDDSEASFSGSEAEADDFSEDYDPIESDMEQMQDDPYIDDNSANFSEADSDSFDDSSQGLDENSTDNYPDDDSNGADDFDDSMNNDFFASSDQSEDDEADSDQDSAIEETPISAEDTSDHISAVQDDEELESFPMASAADPDPVDISDYANSEASSLEDGEFLYDITISRLDSKDLKDALKYVLLDEKLKINHHEYLKKIRDGQVTIPDLNPIKAKRIVEQLQYQELGITWRQKRVVMEVVEPDADGDYDDDTAEDLNA